MPWQARELATLMLPTTTGSMERVLEALLSREAPAGESISQLAVLAAFAAIVFVLTLASLAVQVPYGLFVPHMLFGAAVGHVYGRVVREQIWEDAAHEGIYALMGLGAALGSFTRMTIAITTILVELTGDSSLLLPITLTVLVSKVVADVLAPESFFEELLHVKRFRFMPEFPHRGAAELKAKHAITPDVCCVRATDTLERIARLLTNTRHNGFPIAFVVGSGNLSGVPVHADKLCADVDEEPLFAGAFVTRAQLFDIVHDALVELSAVEEETPRMDRVVVPARALSHTVDVLGTVTGAGKLGMPDALYHHLGMSVPPDLPFNRVWPLFTKLGLRHVLVVNESTFGGPKRLMGIITRENLLRVNSRLAQGHDASSFSASVRNAAAEGRVRRRSRRDSSSRPRSSL